ncbi:LAGLIDADG family homing endonuclease [Candidatus Amesbacteria bacterium]|nr:LAGLIDADG family homing endonuclease [Candidatus Amesbacteria bacterium]
MYSITHSENVMSAVNQQERLNPWWIVGFVDGEGCFSESVFKNATCKSGYQTLYEFVITQGEQSRDVMEAIKKYFGCGSIYINHRHDNHHHDLLRYCVRRQDDLKNIIIPFFRKYPLQSAKREQFEKFCKRLLKI